MWQVSCQVTVNLICVCVCGGGGYQNKNSREHLSRRCPVNYGCRAIWHGSLNNLCVLYVKLRDEF